MDAAGTPGMDERAPESSGPLKRAIGPRLLLLFIVGDILGTGIYARTGAVAGEVGGAIWVSFLVAFVLATLTAFAYAELVTKYPRAAGAALYTNKAFRTPLFTFMVAFAVVCSGLASAGAAARAFGGDYLAEFVSLPAVLVAILFVVVLSLINFRGISESVKTNMVLTLIELSGLLLIVLIGVVVLSGGGGDPGRAFSFEAEGLGLSLAVLSGASVAFYALIGFEDSVNVAEETENPSRAFPRALFGGLAITGIVYLLVAFTASMVVEPGVLAGSTGPLLEVVEAGPLPVPLNLFALVALVAITNTALINLIMASRVVYGMARDGILPSVLGRAHPTRRTPWTAILFTALIALILVSTGDLGALADTTVALLLSVFIVVNIAVLTLRRDPVDHQHFTAPAVIPVIAGLISLALLVLLLAQEPGVLLRAVLLLALGLVLWLINVPLRNRLDRRDAASTEPRE